VAVVSDRVHGKEAEARVSSETALQISVMKLERPHASERREAPPAWFAEKEKKKYRETCEDG
jgi:hypothetical protein